MIVLDASLVINIAGGSEGRQVVLASAVQDGAVLFAPEVVELEVLQTIRRLEKSGAITTQQATDALRSFDDLAISLVSHRILKPRIWELRNNLNAYDAAYFALAEIYQAPLWTSDAKYYVLPGHSVEVVLV